jgi:hypothetical protein
MYLPRKGNAPLGFTKKTAGIKDAILIPTMIDSCLVLKNLS